jgi:hypothetical protein
MDRQAPQPALPITVRRCKAAFGGRAPNDDVIGLELGVLFGNTIPALGLAPDDNKENTCLSAQNIAGGENASKKTTGTFPYLPVPH